MKFYIMTTLIVPSLVMATLKRYLFDLPAIDFPVDTYNKNQICQEVSDMFREFGVDLTEQSCKLYGHKYLTGLSEHICPLCVHQSQELIHHFHIFPATNGKRLLLDTFDSTTLKSELQTLLDVLGSDPTEQACEQKGRQLITDPLLVHAVPLICHSFQSLIAHFHLTAPTTTAS